MTVTGDSEVKRRSGQPEDALFTLKPGVYLFFELRSSLAGSDH